VDAPYQISIEQWRIVVVTGYMLFMKSQYDVIFTFANQHFDEVSDTTCIFRDPGAAVGQGEQ